MKGKTTCKKCGKIQASRLGHLCKDCEKFVDSNAEKAQEIADKSDQVQEVKKEEIVNG